MLAKSKMLSSFNLVNKKEMFHILRMFFFEKKKDHLSTIELRMKDTLPISTQEVMPQEVELQSKYQKNAKNRN